MPQKIIFKRGDTLKRTLVLADADGAAVEVDAIAAEVRTKNGQLIETLSVEPTQTAGTYTMYSSGTEDYPVETLEMDIEILINDIIKSSETFDLVVRRDVTQS